MHVLDPNRVAVRVADDIWSTLPAGTPAAPYDGRAMLYDWLIGNRFYNRLAWGLDPAAYAAFAREASHWGTGPLLDAGCGTLVSTAQIHARAVRPTILVDLSVGMLQAARARLLAINCQLPQQLVLLQADIRDLPFRSGAFATVLCPGMLHLFEDVETVTSGLARVAAADARIFATSLVTDRWLGRHYLGLLNRAGEVAAPRSAAELLRRLCSNGSGLAPSLAARTIGNMAFITAQPA
jgi:SAM-dependent methyltransferase